MVSQKSVCRVAVAMALVVAGATQGSAQTSFKAGEKEVHVHGFVQQGFVATGFKEPTNMLVVRTAFAF